MAWVMWPFSLWALLLWHWHLARALHIALVDNLHYITTSFLYYLYPTLTTTHVLPSLAHLYYYRSSASLIATATTTTTLALLSHRYRYYNYNLRNLYRYRYHNYNPPAPNLGAPLPLPLLRISHRYRYYNYNLRNLYRYCPNRSVAVAAQPIVTCVDVAAKETIFLMELYEIRGIHVVRIRYLYRLT